MFFSIIIVEILYLVHWLLEWAMDALHKLTQMAEEIFGLDAFCTGKQIHKQKENLLGKVIEEFLFPFILDTILQSPACKVVPLISMSFY